MSKAQTWSDIPSDIFLPDCYFYFSTLNLPSSHPNFTLNLIHRIGKYFRLETWTKKTNHKSNREISKMAATRLIQDYCHDRSKLAALMQDLDEKVLVNKTLDDYG